ncbi:MAG TPA: ElyC/SanA/YdcF family protein [Candidatus Aquilonibacter sp.]|nr:ElyC/SanA/YdcF family protein [Candidatus Aquilonibacter sp.]
MRLRPRGATLWLLALFAFAGLLLFAVEAGEILIVNRPRPSDVILVLAGETEYRPERALQLLQQGYGHQVVIDVPEGVKIYEFDQTDLAKRYVLSLPQAAAVSICPITGLSTKAETKDAAKCLAATGARSVLIVTADFHTLRALDIFQRELPQYRYSIAAVENNQQFGAHWWTHRQWAKTLVDEWMRLIWWKLVDRWL